MNNNEKLDFLHFLKQAYADYRHYVAKLGYTYERFWKDYINKHRHATLGENVGEHDMIIGSLEDLLSRRRLLVEHYFMKEVLSDTDFNKLLKEHNTSEIGKHPFEMTGNIDSTQSTSSDKRTVAEPFGIFMTSNRELEDAAKLFNGSYDGGNYCFIGGPIDGEMLLNFLQGNVKLHIVSKMNYKVMFALDVLEKKQLIGSGWKAYLEAKESMLTGSERRALTKGQMSHSLSAGKKSHLDLWDLYFKVASNIRRIL